MVSNFLFKTLFVGILLNSWSDVKPTTYVNREQKKLLLNITVGLLCGSAVSMAIVYHQEIMDLLFGTTESLTALENFIYIDNARCKGRNHMYKDVLIQQVRVPFQKKLECGLQALAFAEVWVYNHQENMSYAEKVNDAESMTQAMDDYIEKNSEIKKLKGQMLDEYPLWQAVDSLKKAHHDNNDKIMVCGYAKNIDGKGSEDIDIYVNDMQTIKACNILPRIRDTFLSEESLLEPVKYSIIMGTMDHTQKRDGHWFAINIAVQSNDLRVVIADSLNSDRTNDPRVRMIIDTLKNNE